MDGPDSPFADATLPGVTPFDRGDDGPNTRDTREHVGPATVPRTSPSPGLHMPLQLGGAASISILSPFMQSQPASYVRSANGEWKALDTLGEASEETLSPRTSVQPPEYPSLPSEEASRRGPSTDASQTICVPEARPRGVPAQCQDTPFPRDAAPSREASMHGESTPSAAPPPAITTQPREVPQKGSGKREAKGSWSFPSAATSGAVQLDGPRLAPARTVRVLVTTSPAMAPDPGAPGTEASLSREFTRLVALPFTTSRAELLRNCLAVFTMRYRLPQDPDTLVDLVDDADVAAMWDELVDKNAGLADAGLAPTKLHLFLSSRWGWVRPSESESDEVGLCVPPTLGSSMGSAADTADDDDDLASGPVAAPGDVWLSSMLGAGTYGDMYRGRWRDCDVGVKVINPALMGMERAGRRDWLDFLAARAEMVSLRHPNLAEVYGFAHQRLPGRLVRGPAVIMEYVSGRSMGTALHRRDDVVAGRQHRLRFLLDTARAMEYLHAKGVTHFDLKSSNILLGWRGRRPVAKVCGYGMSRHSHVGTHAPMPSSHGVLPWTAPEIVRAPETMSAKVDIYSFGIVMWEALTMAAPFKDDLSAYLLRLVNTRDVIRPPVPGLDGELGSVVEPGPGWIALMQECWAEDPAARPDFPTVVDRLRRIAGRARAEEAAAKQAGPLSPRAERD
ncbi:putative serine/threonine-protein kinase [Auxenochlorella protothecoides]|uniref:Putative serine/threonine-protein kinase n=1 Tax=Auxenochlorella protothecoides TaxID=3075 RepID=A0A087SDK8_AUXPR|nr:putative serine/threonine-protein kinase [Auxenochlorella protothecoides]KFM23812.1 putative serine/threonine-protein kinase [Auxenochlorella protothecoides]